MRCEFVKDRGQNRVLLILSAEELKYEIQNVAFAQGDVARVHDNYGHDLLGDRGENYMHQWKDVCEDGNWERVKRTIGIAISEIEQILYRFTASLIPCSGVSLDNMVTFEPKEYMIELRVLDSFSKSSAQYILKLVHEYIVDSVLEDWATITYPEAVATWSMKKASTEEKLRHASHYKMERPSVKPSII